MICGSEATHIVCSVEVFSIFVVCPIVYVLVELLLCSTISVSVFVFVFVYMFVCMFVSVSDCHYRVPKHQPSSADCKYCWYGNIPYQCNRDLGCSFLYLLFAFLFAFLSILFHLTPLHSQPLHVICFYSRLHVCVIG